MRYTAKHTALDYVQICHRMCVRVCMTGIWRFLTAGKVGWFRLRRLPRWVMLPKFRENCLLLQYRSE